MPVDPYYGYYGEKKISETRKTDVSKPYSPYVPPANFEYNTSTESGPVYTSPSGETIIYTRDSPSGIVVSPSDVATPEARARIENPPQPPMIDKAKIAESVAGKPNYMLQQYIPYEFEKEKQNVYQQWQMAYAIEERRAAMEKAGGQYKYVASGISEGVPVVYSNATPGYFYEKPQVTQRDYSGVAENRIANANAMVALQNKQIEAKNKQILGEQEARKVGFDLTSRGSQFFNQSGISPNQMQFTQGFVVGGVLGSIDLLAETVKNPIRGANLFVEGLTQLPDQFVKNPVYTTGALAGSAVFFKGARAGLGKAGGFVKGAEVPKAEIAKVSIPTELQVTRSAMLTGEVGDIGPFLRSTKNAEFIKSSEFTLKNPIIEVTPEVRGTFSRSLETTRLTESATGRLGGSIVEKVSFGEAIVKQGEIKPLSPGVPFNDIVSLARASKGMTGPDILTFEKPSSTILGGKELIPANYKPLSTEAAALKPGEGLEVRLQTKGAGELSSIQIAKALTARSKEVGPFGGAKSAGILFKENLRVNLNPEIVEVKAKTYSPNYFSREPIYRGFYKETPKLSSYFEQGPRRLTTFTPKLGGNEPLSIKLLTGETNTFPSAIFKRFRPFESPKGGSELSVTAVNVGGGMKALQFVKQIYKRNAKVIPVSATKSETVVKVPEAVASLVQVRKVRPRETFEFETIRYPQGQAITQPQFIGAKPQIGYVPAIQASRQVSIFRGSFQQTQISPSRLKTFGLLSPNLKSALIPLEIQRTSEIQKQIALTKQIQMPKQFTGQATGEITRQRQGQLLIQPQRFSPKNYLLQKYTGQLIPKELIQPFNQFESKPKKKVEEEEGFNILFRRFGKFFKVNLEPLSRGEAFDLGVEKALNTLGATFRLVPSGTRVRGEGGQPSLNKFYEKGKDTFIQKRRFRLGTVGEKQEIQEAKKRSEMRWGLWDF